MTTSSSKSIQRLMLRVFIGVAVGFAAVVLYLFGSFAMKRPKSETITFPFAIHFQPEDANFLPGDQVTIQRVLGTDAAIRVGQTYYVEGTYVLGSHDHGLLSFSATTGSPMPGDPHGNLLIEKGTGTFRLVKTLNTDGRLHISFYPEFGGEVFGGVYFSQIR